MASHAHRTATDRRHPTSTIHEHEATADPSVCLSTSATAATSHAYLPLCARRTAPRAGILATWDTPSRASTRTREARRSRSMAIERENTKSRFRYTRECGPARCRSHRGRNSRQLILDLAGPIVLWNSISQSCSIGRHPCPSSTPTARWRFSRQRVRREGEHAPNSALIHARPVGARRAGDRGGSVLGERRGQLSLPSGGYRRGFPPVEVAVTRARSACRAAEPSVAHDDDRPRDPGRRSHHQEEPRL